MEVLFRAFVATSLACVGCGSTRPLTSDAETTQPSDALQDAAMADANADAKGDPRVACETPLVPSASCNTEVRAPDTRRGGSLPEGEYDRVAIRSLVPQVDSVCRGATVWFRQGVFQTTLHDLGGPYVQGGTYRLDEATGKLGFEFACERPKSGGLPAPATFGYAWDSGSQRLSVFPDSSTEWIYARRR